MPSAWNRHNNVAGLNRLMGSTSSHLDNMTSNGNSIEYIYKQTIKRMHRFACEFLLSLGARHPTINIVHRKL
jgi:hypothetical protein